nr:retrovirus-related Pol polyprotein from transposon TNT 1-94 [Tanacetum cinerariifolium]
MKICKGALVLIKAIQSGGLYVLQGTVVYGTAGVATPKASLEDSKLWHYRLGHMGEKGMKNLAKKGLIKVSCNLEFCEHCVFGKQKRVSFSLGIHRTRDALDYIHSDLWGPSPVTSRGGKKIKKLRTDNGLEICGESFNALCRKVFGCPIYVHVNEGKLVPRAVKCIFLGYGSGVKGYRVWCPDPKYRKIVHSRDVTFNEDVIINSGKDFVPPHNVDNNHTEGKELVRLPKEKRVISYKWLFKVKDGIPGVESNRYKARYVVCGFDQREGIDFIEVFSLVVRHNSIIVLLSIVALQDLELKQIDVKTTFLHGHLEEENYVEQPEGFKVPEKEDHVCRLKKSLYGLKQSLQQWYKRFDSFMIGHGYDRCSYDECVYLRKFPDGSFLYLVLYVADMLIAAPNKDHIRELKDQLSNEFYMKDLGDAKRILGMEIQRDREMGRLTLSQTDYISKVLKKFNMSSCKPVPTPLAPHFKLSSHECSKSEEDKEDMSRVPYSSAVGSLMYAMVCTRPDLAHDAEYISSTERVKEVIWLRGMVNEFGLPQELALLVFDTLRGAATTTMKSYGFWFKVEIVRTVSQKL